MEHTMCFPHFRDEIIDSQDGIVCTHICAHTHTHTHTHTQRHDVKYKPDHVTLFMTNSERWTVGSSSHVRDRFLYKTLLAPVVWLPFQPRFPSYLTHYCLIVQLYDRGWDGWRALPTWWTWVWVDSGSWWWIGRSGMLQSMGSQRDTTEQLNWTEPAIPNSHSSLHQEFHHLHSFLLPCDLCPLSLLSFSTPLSAWLSPVWVPDLAQTLTPPRSLDWLDSHHVDGVRGPELVLPHQRLPPYSKHQTVL